MPQSGQVHALGAKAAVAAPLTQNSQEQAPQEPQTPSAESPDSQQEPAEEELAPAALQLDVSNDSPLIRELYQATRETKEQPILAHLAESKKLIDGGADVKATDAQGRTALHWAVFGSSYNTKPKIVVAYEEIADSLIDRGVEINREDTYQDTALDYLLYSPNFEMQTLLIEHGASIGFLVVSYNPLSQEATGEGPKPTIPLSSSRKIDLVPGHTLSIRLDVPVYSDGSRTGDPVTATVTYPLCKNGEQVACKEGELLVPPGTKVNGTILFAQKAPDKYSRPRLVLDFSNIVHKNGLRSPLYARVLDVDNARETIRNNEILGIIQPHASTKASMAIAAVSAANPIAGYTIKGIQTVYGLSIRREISFPAGTDIQIQIVRGSSLKQKEIWPGWSQLSVDQELQKLAEGAPARTNNYGNTFSDPTNLLFLGDRNQLAAAFGEAGWFEADDLGVKSAIKAAQATVRQSGYTSGPVSTLLLQGRPPDLVFQKSLDTFAKRHHVRIWKLDETYRGQAVWIGAATHDIATSSSRGGSKWSHRIDPHVDRERDWVTTDLLFI
ncbi:MAG TPA: LssY C-terminal domain-containing protein, partial [Chthoniobacterales bacterium]|nr:LssY C-terminal domain-containing protein [Chthoniobacterales bacterium]